MHLDAPGHAATVDHLLERHPVYATRLKRAEGYQLSDHARQALYWAKRARTAAELADRLGISTATLRPLLRELARLDLAQLVPLGEACHRRQHFLTTQEYRVPTAEQTLAHLWQRAVARYAENPLLTALADGSECTYAEAAALVTPLRAALQRAGLHPGDRVLLLAPLHAEGLLLAWASGARASCWCR